MLKRVDTYHVVVIAPCEVGRGAILKIGFSKVSANDGKTIKTYSGGILEAIAGRRVKYLRQLRIRVIEPRRGLPSSGAGVSYLSHEKLRRDPPQSATTGRPILLLRASNYRCQ